MFDFQSIPDHFTNLVINDNIQNIPDLQTQHLIIKLLNEINCKLNISLVVKYENDIECILKNDVYKFFITKPFDVILYELCNNLHKLDYDLSCINSFYLPISTLNITREIDNDYLKIISTFKKGKCRKFILLGFCIIVKNDGIVYEKFIYIKNSYKKFLKKRVKKQIYNILYSFMLNKPIMKKNVYLCNKLFLLQHFNNMRYGIYINNFYSPINVNVYNTLQTTLNSHVFFKKKLFNMLDDSCKEKKLLIEFLLYLKAKNDFKNILKLLK